MCYFFICSIQLDSCNTNNELSWLIELNVSYIIIFLTIFGFLLQVWLEESFMMNLVFTFLYLFIILMCVKAEAARTASESRQSAAVHAG